MNKFLPYLIFLFLFSCIFINPDTALSAPVTGTVQDCSVSPSVPLEGAIVYEYYSELYEFTDSSGNFSIDLPYGYNYIIIWYPGYMEYLEEIELITAYSMGVVCLYPDTDVGLLYGTVTDSNDHPISGAYVGIDDYSIYTFTDPYGYYWLELPSGSINMLAAATGYQDETFSVEIIGGETIQHNINMTLGDDHCDSAGSCATSLVVNGNSIPGDIESAGDTDWFQFNAVSGSDYEIITSSLGPGSDTLIYLYRSDGVTLIASDDDGGEDLASKIAWTADQSGSFYIMVKQFSASETGTYAISVTGPDDHCNIASSCATPLDISGTPVPGMIDEPGDIDWFRFTAVSGVAYDIETSGLGDVSDTVIYLYRSDGTTLVASDDDGGEGFASKITWFADTPGTYYIEVTHYSPSGTGSYYIGVGEYDDHCDTGSSCATPLRPDGTTVTGNFETDSDEDWFRFQAVSTQPDGPDKIYTIETSNLSSTPGCDTVIYLYSSEGTLIDYNDDCPASPTLASCIEWTTSSVDEGIFYVKVVHYFTTGRGTYDISVIGDDHTDIYMNWATPVSTNGITVAGNIDTAGVTSPEPKNGDRDLFRFSAYANRAYTIETSNLVGCDTHIYLYDSNGLPITNDDDSGSGLASKIIYTPSTDGYYYVQVRHYADAGTGTYDIGVTTADDHANTYESATIVSTDASQVPGLFESAGDVDWFEFTATSGQQYVIETGNLTGNCDTIMELYSTNGSTQLAQDDDGGTGLASRLEWIAPSSDTFYVRLRHFSSQGTGGYSVWVRVLSTEGNDTMSGAEEITVGVPLTGRSINPAGDVDWYKFDAVAGATYGIDTSNLDSACDTVIYLYDQSGNLIHSDDDSGTGLASSITWQAGSTATYFVLVKHFSSLGVGTYDISVQSLSASCTSISSGSPVSGTISTDGEGELYCLSVSAGDRITVNLNGPSGADFDLYLRLGVPPTLIEYDARGYTSSAQETCESVATEAATLYIWVKSYSGTGDFSLTASVQSDYTPTCTTLTEGVPSSGSMSGQGDDDLYCMTVNQGDQVVITLDGPDSGADFDLYVKHGAPPSVDDYDVRGYTPFADEVAALEGLSSGTLYIMVASYSGSGSYSLDVQVSATPSGCIMLSSEVTQEGTLYSDFDDELYCFGVSTGDQITVDLSGPGGTDFDLYLKYGSAPTFYSYDVASTSADSEETINYTALSSGTVYILVISYSGSGNYTITATKTGSEMRLSKSPSGEVLIVKGSITDKQSARMIQPNNFCIDVKNFQKYCYSSSSSSNQISYIPGGYFMFIIEQSLNDYTFTLSDIQCYLNSDPEVFAEAELSNVVFEIDIDPPSDCDGDGMDNGWEKQYGLDVWKDDSMGDLDKDNYTNLEEYIAQSNPLDRESVPQGGKNSAKPAPWLLLLLFGD